MINTKEIATINSTNGDVVIFPWDAVLAVAIKLKVTVDDLIDELGGVSHALNGPGKFGVDRLVAIDSDGKTHPVVMVGAPEETIRFLEADETEFRDYLKSHPKNSEVGVEANFNQEIFQEICNDYRDYLLAKEPTLVANSPNIGG